LLGGVDRCLKTTTAAVGAVAIQAQSNVRDIDSADKWLNAKESLASSVVS